MATYIAIGVVLLIILVGYFSRNKIRFIAMGLDFGFSFSEIMLLWKLSIKCEIHDPNLLYFSDKEMSKCIALIIEDAKDAKPSEAENLQNFLAKLYDFKTKTFISSSLKKGLSSTRSINLEQKIVILFKGHGVYTSKVINNGHELTVKFPEFQHGKVKPRQVNWEGAVVSVYFWRTNDANYVFDTQVLASGSFRGTPVLYLRHTDILTRLQKRKSVRAVCQIPAKLFILKVNQNGTLERYSEIGYNCILEDISETGASIKIGGKGLSKINVKVYFTIENEQVIMTGVIRSSEFNAESNISKLHLECMPLEKKMRNVVLAYVYNIHPLSNEEKEVEQSLNILEEEQSEQSQSMGIANNIMNRTEIPQDIETDFENLVLDKVDLNSMEETSTEKK